MNDTPKKNFVVKMLAIFLIVVAVFVTGFYLGKSDLSNSPVAQQIAGYNLIGDQKSNFANVNVNLLWEVWSKVQSDYLQKNVDGQQLLYGAAKGLIQGLNDPYSAFLSPTDTQDYYNSNKGEFEGIGATLKQEGQYTAVESPIDGFPAQKAGLLANDVFLEVDGKTTKNLSVYQVATLIRGTAGTDVNLTIYRTSTDKQFSVKITRQKINIDNVTFMDLGNDVVKIKIYKFTEESVAVFNAEWDSVVEKVLAKKNVKGIVIDLRNNPGGYVAAVEYVLGEFLPKGKVLFSEEDRDGNRVEHKVERTGKLLDVPVVVEVNAGSASASEIFAGAMQDNGRAKIVGTTTVGKGVEQKLITLSDGSTLELVFQKWLTPSGKNISKDSPIKPDENIDDYDQQDKRAIEIVSK